MDGFIQFSFIGPGGPEILVVMLVLLVMFGARDAPRIFRKLNDMLNQIRSTAEHFRHEMMYSDIRADSDQEDDLGEYDDYGLGADADAEADDTEAPEPGEEPAGSGDEHGDGDVKSV